MNHDTDIKKQALVNPGTHESTTNTKKEIKKCEATEDLHTEDKEGKNKLFKWEWKL